MLPCVVLVTVLDRWFCRVEDEYCYLLEGAIVKDARENIELVLLRRHAKLAQERVVYGICEPWRDMYRVCFEIDAQFDGRGV